MDHQPINCLQFFEVEVPHYSRELMLQLPVNPCLSLQSGIIDQINKSSNGKPQNTATKLPSRKRLTSFYDQVNTRKSSCIAGGGRVSQNLPSCFPTKLFTLTVWLAFGGTLGGVPLFLILFVLGPSRKKLAFHSPTSTPVVNVNLKSEPLRLTQCDKQCSEVDAIQV